MGPGSPAALTAATSRPHIPPRALFHAPPFRGAPEDELLPKRGPSTLIWGALPFGDDSLQLEIVDRGNQWVRRARDEVHRANGRVTWAQDFGKQPLSLSKGPRAQVLSLEREDVEHEHRHCRPVGRPQPGARGVEVCAPVLIHDHELAIQDHMLSSEAPHAGHHLGHVALDQPSPPHANLNRGPVLPEQDSAAVQFRLVQPARARGGRLRRGDELKADGAGREAFHAIRL